jgi:acetyl esterase/lipase
MSLARRGILSGLLGALAGCSPAALLNTTVSRKGYALEADIPYGSDPRQKLDLYRPDTPRPDGKAVIFFYGGSWDSGTKSDYLFVAQAFAANGLTVVIPDYRIYPEVRFPAFIEDAAAATRWTTDRVGTEKLVVMGHSAGAHSALMLVSNTRYLADVGVDRMKLAGTIGLAGPYDFLPLTSRRLQEIFGGANDPAVQPITFAQTPLPPVLLLHGEADRTVYPRNTVRLAAAWKAAGGSAEMKLYPDVDHVDIVAALSSFLRARAPTLADSMAFIDRH